MSSESREYSLTEGMPLKLFRFTRGTTHWRYTNADRVIEHDGHDYLPLAISHTEVRDTGEVNQASIVITMPKDAPVAANWHPWPPGDTITVTVWTQHYGETDALVDWLGRVVSPRWNDKELRLTSEPGQTRGRRGSRGRVWQRPCDRVLYGCGVDPADHELPATLSDVTGFTLTSAAFLALPAGRLAGGFVEWTDSDSWIHRRTIEEHPGETIVIDYGGQDLADGLELVAYPGCAGTWADCEYYENTDNYGGHLFMPGRNYWDGNPVRE
jgi:uncharacterized phage protein (TIGR02218 family)